MGCVRNTPNVRPQIAMYVCPVYGRNHTTARADAERDTHGCALTRITQTRNRSAHGYGTASAHPERHRRGQIGPVTSANRLHRGWAVCWGCGSIGCVPYPEHAGSTPSAGMVRMPSRRICRFVCLIRLRRSVPTTVYVYRAMRHSRFRRLPDTRIDGSPQRFMDCRRTAAADSRIRTAVSTRASVGGGVTSANPKSRRVPEARGVQKRSHP